MKTRRAEIHQHPFVVAETNGLLKFTSDDFDFLRIEKSLYRVNPRSGLRLANLAGMTALRAFASGIPRGP